MIELSKAARMVVCAFSFSVDAAIFYRNPVCKLVKLVK